LTHRPLVFATRNRGKLVELRSLLPELVVLDLDEAARRYLAWKSILADTAVRLNRE